MKINELIYILVGVSSVLLGDAFLPRPTPVYTGSPKAQGGRAYKCDFNHTGEIGSTDRDAVFFYATWFSNGLLLSIRSLRSSGSRCRIILFASSKFKWNSMLNGLGIEFIPNCDYSYNSNSNPHMGRYIFERKWLEQNIETVDRVFHADSFDTFFQGDPFQPMISKDRLTLIIEPHLFKGCGWNMAWIQKCYPNSIPRILKEYIICSGSIIGSAYQYHKLLTLMMNETAWKTCWSESMDQPILNWVIWTGIGDKAGLQYEFTGCDNGYMTMQWCTRDHKVTLNERGQVVTRSGNPPVFLHQYNRFEETTAMLNRACHIN